jgi:hypothetical protein
VSCRCGGTGLEGWIGAVVKQIPIEAMELIAVAGLEEVQDMMDEVVDLHDYIIAEPGHRDRPKGEAVGGDRVRG